MDASDTVYRPAAPSDWPKIWPIFHEVVRAGDTYAYLPDTQEPEAQSLWMQPGTNRRFTYVADRDGAIIATAYLKPNAIGLGDHICNAGWMVSPNQSGQGVGRQFARYVMEQAKSLGFAGMQFNAVVASNVRAVRLWESMGFQIVGTVPDAFRHGAEDLVPVHIMYREL